MVRTASLGKQMTELEREQWFEWVLYLVVPSIVAVSYLLFVRLLIDLFTRLWTGMGIWQ